MKLGIYLNSQHPAGDDPARRYAETLEQVRLIRSLGFDSIWAGEHHVTPGFHFFPQLALLQSIAAAAEGTVDRHQRHPAAAAQSDRAGGDRRLHGCRDRRQVSARRRPRLSARGVRDVWGGDVREGKPARRGGRDHRRLWTEDRVTHRGRHWQFSDATIRPRPLQSPRPPIIIGAQVEAAIKRAATIGDGWLVVPIPTLDQLAKQMSIYQSARSAAKLPPSPHVCRLLEVGCAPDDDTALRRIAPFLMEKYKAYFSWGLEGLSLDPNATP